MLNKTDKWFFITSISIFALLMLSFVAALVFAGLNANTALELVFGFVVIITFVLLPISIVIQSFTLIIKVFAKDKTKKDWIVILINLISIFIFSLILLMLYVATTNPLL